MISYNDTITFVWKIKSGAGGVAQLPRVLAGMHEVLGLTPSSAQTGC